MSFFQLLADFFKSLFGSGNPGSIKEPQIKQIEIELSKLQPPLYKNGEVQPVVGKAFSILYTHTNALHKIFDFMDSSEDGRLRNRVLDTLIQTGYMGNSKEMLDSLTYEARKEKLEHCGNQQHEIESQSHMFMELQKELQTANFALIEKTLKDLELFYDLCNFDFISALKLFTSSGDLLDSKNTFSPVHVDKLDMAFLDLYYVTAELELNGSFARAVIAVLSIAPEKKEIYSPDDIMLNLKKIASVLNKILTKDILKKFIALATNDASAQPEFSIIKHKLLENYINREREQFKSDEQRLMIELQDKHLEREIKKLFGYKPLLSLEGYNSQNDETLKNSSPVAFLWITPMQVIKTFTAFFFEERVQNFLSDVILEGFFTKAEYKTDFSSGFFSCQDTSRLLSEFENSFERERKNDTALMLGYLRDSQKDTEFARSLTRMVDAINIDAKNFVQNQVTIFYDLYKQILRLCDDAHKANPETVSNIKFLFTSSRNRERVDFLEKSLPKWGLFLELMKNYAVIGMIEASREEQLQQE